MPHDNPYRTKLPQEASKKLGWWARTKERFRRYRYRRRLMERYGFVLCCPVCGEMVEKYTGPTLLEETYPYECLHCSSVLHFSFCGCSPMVITLQNISRDLPAIPEETRE